MWAVFFLIIPNVGPSSPNSDFQYQSVPHLEVGSRRPAEFLVELSFTNLFYILVYCFVWIYGLEIFPFLFNKIVSIGLNHPAAL